MIRSRKSRQWKSAAARRLLQLANNPLTIEEAVGIVATRTIEGLPHPPLILDSLFGQLNISGVKDEDISFSGELRPENGKYTIVCSSRLSPGRRRFTIAHEIAHAIFDLSGPNCPRIGMELERLCDMLATELLMPKDLFLVHAGGAPDIDKIFELARVFQTSITATAIRCAELLRFSVFEVSDGCVRWGYGLVRKGPLHHLGCDLQDLIGTARQDRRGNAVIYLNIRGNTGIWNVQYRAISKDGFLFALRPYVKREPASESVVVRADRSESQQALI